jgi:hypothetical protein
MSDFVFELHSFFFFKVELFQIVLESFYCQVLLPCFLQIVVHHVCHADKSPQLIPVLILHLHVLGTPGNCSLWNQSLITLQEQRHFSPIKNR